MPKFEIKAGGPLGPSERGRGFGTHWNNLHAGWSGPVTCEICGTEHPNTDPDTYIVSKFLGKTVVEECCGAIFDRVFGESGEEFFEAYLDEFAENPTDIRFFGLTRTLISALSKAKKKLQEEGKGVEDALNKTVEIWKEGD